MKIIIPVLLLSLFGCSSLMKAQDKSAEEIARLITQYCESTDQDFRDGVRQDINKYAAPHTIVVTCN